MAVPRAMPIYPIRLVVVYDGPSAVLRDQAEQIAVGAREVGGVDARLLPIHEPLLPKRASTGAAVGQLVRGNQAPTLQQLTSADAIVVGTQGSVPVLKSPVQGLFADPSILDQERPPGRPGVDVLRNKVGAVFGASAPSGVDVGQTCQVLAAQLMQLGMIVVTGEPSTAVDLQPVRTLAAASSDEEADRQLGHRVAEVTLWLRFGQVHLQRDRGW